MEQTAESQSRHSGEACPGPRSGGRNPAAIIAEAREWIGTDWQHQASLKGVATDCVGLVIGVGKNCGLIDRDLIVTGYPRAPRPKAMRAALAAYLDPVPVSEIRPADIFYLLSNMRMPQHLAIYTFDDTVIHAMDLWHGVVEHRFDEAMRNNLVAVFRYRGIE